MNRMLRKKLGKEIPSMVSPLMMRSEIVFRTRAAWTPRGIETRSVRTITIKPRRSVTWILSERRSLTGME